MNDPTLGASVMRASTERTTYKYRVEDGIVLVESGIRDLDVDREYFYVRPDGWLVLRSGFRWDGSTCARDTDTSMIASAAHDVFCQLINDGEIGKEHQKPADRMYARLCHLHGMSRLRSWLRYVGLRLFAMVGGHKLRPKGGRTVRIYPPMIRGN